MNTEWLALIAQARMIPFEDLERHARVSTQNSHQCTSCFCCACVVVLKERASLVRKSQAMKS